MKHKLYFIAFACSLLFCCSTPSQPKEYFVRPNNFIYSYTYNDTTKLVITCRVWGLLKYFHPNVTAGKLDWDKILLDGLNSIYQSSSPEQVNVALKKMLEVAGDYTYKKNDEWNDSLNMNVNLGWLDHSFLDDTLKDELKKIASLSVRYPSYYGIDIDSAKQVFLPQHEEMYDVDIYSSLEFRLLALFRYWNVIYYFSPNKYLMDKSWDETLSESIFPFICASDIQSYQVSFLKLAASLNDGHGYISFANHYPPASENLIEIVEGKTVVRVGHGELKNGDIIKYIENRDIGSIRDSLSFLIPASTQGNKEYRINCFVSNMIFFNETEVTILRNGQDLKVNMYPVLIENKRSRVFKRISNDIGYVDLSRLTTEKIDSVFSTFSDASGIIFDLRKTGQYRYNVRQLECYLSEAKVNDLPTSVYWELEHPGTFLWNRNTSFSIPNNIKCSPYQGKVIYLINESTQSFTETQAWIGQANFNATLIGRSTSGALGQVVWIPLPGNHRAAFSGFGLFSLDGTALQRRGIEPDIEVHPTLESIKAGEDEILESAIKYLTKD